MLQNILKNKVNKFQNDFINTRHTLLPFTYDLKDFLGLLLYLLYLNTLTTLKAKLIDKTAEGVFVGLVFLFNIFPSFEGLVTFLISEIISLFISLFTSKNKLETKMVNIALFSIILERCLERIFNKDIKQILIIMFTIFTIEQHEKSFCVLFENPKLHHIIVNHQPVCYVAKNY